MLHMLMGATPTAALRLHDMALALGIAANCSPYTALCLTLVVSIGASVVADAFARTVRSHPDQGRGAVNMSLDKWATFKVLSV